MSTDQDLNLKPSVCYFGTIISKGNEKAFGILQEDRRKHMYVLGKTGAGKTTLLENMILQDIYHGHGVCFIDPHGDCSEYILDRIPAHRQNDVIYLNPADTDFPVGLNMLQPETNEEVFLIASGIIGVFNRIWSGMWSARMEYILNNTLLALLETPGHTLLDVIQMLTDANYRKNVIKDLTDPLVKNFWTKEFNSFNERYKQEAISPILNKIGQFFSADLIRNILGQSKSTINFREIMDSGKILIVNLSKGRLGEDNSNLLGSLIVTKLQLAAMSRVDIAEENRKDFYLFVDEFQNFTTNSFATILSEARKYKLNLVIAHQYINQLSEAGNDKIKNAIFGNVGNLISFQVGSEDAQLLSNEFAPDFTQADLINLGKTEIAVRMTINGKKSKAFLAKTISPIFDKLNGQAQTIIDLSRQKYASIKELVALRINQSFDGLKLQNRPNDTKLTFGELNFQQSDSDKQIQNFSIGSNNRLVALKKARNNISIKSSSTVADEGPLLTISSEDLFNLPGI